MSRRGRSVACLMRSSVPRRTVPTCNEVSMAAANASSMAAASASSTAAVADNGTTANLLEQMSCCQADVELVFDEAHDTTDKDGMLLAHSLVLAMHSNVLKNALEVEDDNKSRESGKPRRLPMPGSLKADFMKVAPFMYPVLPLPEVSWENLETLLTEGRKWDMAVVLAHAEKFMHQNARKLDMTADSQKFAFKWLTLADAAGLKNAVEVCIDRIVSDSPSLCTVDRLQGLSPGTLQQLVVQMVASQIQSQAGSETVNARYCSNCCRSRAVSCKCSYCGRRSDVSNP